MEGRIPQGGASDMRPPYYKLVTKPTNQRDMLKDMRIQKHDLLTMQQQRFNRSFAQNELASVHVHLDNREVGIGKVVSGRVQINVKDIPKHRQPKLYVCIFGECRELRRQSSESVHVASSPQGLTRKRSRTPFAKTAMSNRSMNISRSFASSAASNGGSDVNLVRMNKILWFDEKKYNLDHRVTGEYLFEFRFNVPYDLPQSLELALGNSESASIAYSVGANIVFESKPGRKAPDTRAAKTDTPSDTTTSPAKLPRSERLNTKYSVFEMQAFDVVHPSPKSIPPKAISTTLELAGTVSDQCLCIPIWKHVRAKPCPISVKMEMNDRVLPLRSGMEFKFAILENDCAFPVQVNVSLVARCFNRKLRAVLHTIEVEPFDIFNTEMESTKVAIPQLGEMLPQYQRGQSRDFVNSWFTPRSIAAQDSRRTDSQATRSIQSLLESGVQTSVEIELRLLCVENDREAESSHLFHIPVVVTGASELEKVDESDLVESHLIRAAIPVGALDATPGTGAARPPPPSNTVANISKSRLMNQVDMKFQQGVLDQKQYKNVVDILDRSIHDGESATDHLVSLAAQLAHAEETAAASSVGHETQDAQIAGFFALMKRASRRLSLLQRSPGFSERLRSLANKMALDNLTGGGSSVSSSEAVVQRRDSTQVDDTMITAVVTTDELSRSMGDLSVTSEEEEKDDAASTASHEHHACGDHYHHEDMPAWRKPAQVLVAAHAAADSRNKHSESIDSVSGYIAHNHLVDMERNTELLDDVLSMFNFENLESDPILRIRSSKWRVRFLSTFHPIYYRNDRKHLQCFPLCEEFGEYSRGRLANKKHSAKKRSNCLGNVDIQFHAPATAVIQAPKWVEQDVVVIGKIMSKHTAEKNASVIGVGASFSLGALQALVVERHYVVAALDVMQTNQRMSVSGMAQMVASFVPKGNWSCDERLDVKERQSSNASQFCFEAVVFVKERLVDGDNTPADPGLVNDEKYVVISRTTSSSFELAHTRKIARLAKRKGAGDNSAPSTPTATDSTPAKASSSSKGKSVGKSAGKRGKSLVGSSRPRKLKSEITPAMMA